MNSHREDIERRQHLREMDKELLLLLLLIRNSLIVRYPSNTIEPRDNMVECSEPHVGDRLGGNITLCEAPYCDRFNPCHLIKIGLKELIDGPTKSTTKRDEGSDAYWSGNVVPHERKTTKKDDSV